MRIAVVGCGVIGQRRALVAQRLGDDVRVVADPVAERAEAVAAHTGATPVGDWRAAVEADVDAVVVATTHDHLAPVTVAALGAGKHVLCEKPLGRTPDECRDAVRAAEASSGKVLKAGFNHRHHPAVRKMRELLAGGAVGPLLFMRCRYGHGGRPGYEREWRGSLSVAGGGELLDQGVHAIDLFRWLAGDFAEAFGWTASYVWPTETEDNAFALFRTASGLTASLHASWTQWRNLFSFEAFGRDGYLVVDGLGGSYGPERLVWGRRRPESGPPDEQEWVFEGPDVSWDDEWREFTDAIREGREPLGNGHDAWQAVRMVDAVYRSSRTGAAVAL